ncbi:MAG: helix-turn-helix domain-containing protein [Bacilli bacterium]|jgi:transcriptional regulator with XRE-family HTH domain|nr:helix-turn-helix domain-containing protein [Bacilli bacterium]
MIDLPVVGKKIALLRTDCKMSQDELSERLCVSRQAISAWELGKSAPSIDNVIELSKIFNVSFEEILCLGEVKYDPVDPFKGHERSFIIKSVLSGKIKTDINALFYECTYEERLALCRGIKDGRIALSHSFDPNKLTGEEITLIGMKGDK